MQAFSNPDLVAGYAEKTAQLVPGLRDLHRMAGVLLAEQAPEDARILVLGAGGGQELKAWAEMHAGWSFDGVDPSAEMLALALTTLGPLGERVRWHEGYIDTASTELVDGAACLLTLHFLPAAVRLHTLKELHRRLKPGAPLVVAHYSIPGDPATQLRWLQRNAAFATAAGMPAEQTARNALALQSRLPLLTPEQDAELLHTAGYTDVALFYCAFSFRGWVARRG